MRLSSRVARDPVNIHIEELVLHGFASSDRHRIARAVETELARLMSASTAPRWHGTPAALEAIHAGAFKIDAGAKPQSAGAEIARTVFRSLRQSSTASRRAGVFGVRLPS
jgi:hypothetical protein